MNTEATVGEQARAGGKSRALEWVLIFGLVYFLLIAVGTISAGFKLAAGDQAKTLFDFARNPVTGLVVGTVATALIQSSSTVTSIIVGLVAGGLPVTVAIPMIMGANIGTTLTNTLVSLGHVRQGEEFRRAFAAGTIHDFFNILCVILFLPLEILFHPLERLAGGLANLMLGGASMDMKGFDFMKALTKPALDVVQGAAGTLGSLWGGIIMIALGIALIFFVITWMGKLLRSLLVGRAKEILHTAVGRGPVSGIVSGTAVTVLVQSSSTTTSLIVPLAGTGVFSLRQVYPFTLGANIGTCITALLAATAVTGPAAIFAMQIALVHLLYNVIGVILVYGIPLLRNVPIVCAEKLAEATMRRKIYALAYIASVFFIIPGVLIGGSQLLGI